MWQQMESRRLTCSITGGKPVWFATSTFLTWFCHLMPSIWRWHFMWTLSRVLTSSTCKVHIFAAYRTWVERTDGRETPNPLMAAEHDILIHSLIRLLNQSTSNHFQKCCPIQPLFKADKLLKIDKRVHVKRWIWAHLFAWPKRTWHVLTFCFRHRTWIIWFTYYSYWAVIIRNTFDNLGGGHLKLEVRDFPPLDLSGFLSE